MGLGFPPRKSNGASTISVMPPTNPHLAIVGKVGTAAAPAAALQSRADAPAPAAAAAPWPTVLPPLGAIQTSSDPPLAGSICPAVPLVVSMRPAVPANVRKMTQPLTSVIVMPVVGSNWMFNVEFGLMQTLPRFGMRNVAPMPFGVSINAPDGTLP